MRLNESTFVSPEDVRLIDTAQAVAYLQSRGWSERAGAGRGVARVFYRQENRLMEASVPTAPDLDDYAFILSRSVAVIAEFEKRPQGDVYLDMLFYVDDVIEVADKGPDTNNGTLSFSRGDALYAGIRKTLLSTAHLEIGAPKQHYVRLQRKEADLFLSRCRLGQTRRGSYIMTVSCPLNAVPSSSIEPGKPPLPYFATEPEHTPFTRRVTSRLMSSADLIVKCAENDDLTSATQTLDSATLISTNLCDGLLQLAPEIPGSELKLGVRWAKKQPLPDAMGPPASVTLKEQHRPFIESVRLHLREAAAPATKQVFIGRVDSLDGDINDQGQREGNVFFHVIDEHRQPRRVRVWLDRDAHHAAWEAYDQNLPVRFSGVLKIAGGDLFTVEQYADFSVSR